MAGQPGHTVVVYGRAAASPSLSLVWKFITVFRWSSLHVNYSKRNNHRVGRVLRFLSRSSELGLSHHLSLRRVPPPPLWFRGGGHACGRGGWVVPIPTRDIHWYSLYIQVLCGINSRIKQSTLNNFVLFHSGAQEKHDHNVNYLYVENWRTFDHEALVRHSLSTILRKISWLNPRWKLFGKA